MSSPNARIGNYRVVRVLGEGGMGTVYEAVHDGIGRRVAIKILHPEYARQPEIVKRLLNEARAVNVVPHPGLVQISECGQTEDGTAYLVMEYLDGETLRARLQKHGGKLPEAQAVRFLGQLADALAAAHAGGIVHRDLKPGNVMVVRDSTVPGGERVKLVDFGIAKLGQQLGRTDDVRTRTGVMMGTPRYMAPEQCLGAASVDGKADVYSLGVMMFELLTGAPPFVAEAELAVLNMHITQVPPPLQKMAPAASGASARLVKRMLSKPTSERPTMAEVARLLQAQDATLLHEEVLVIDPEDAGETRLSLRDSATLRPSGEKLAAGGRRGPLALLGTGLALTAVVLLAIWVSPRSKPSGSQVLASRPAATLAAPRQEVQPEVKPQPGSPGRTVVSRLNSQPAGAAVVRLVDGRVLGVTPWHQEQPAQARELAVELRLPGYQPRPVIIRLDQDVARSEVLAAEAKPLRMRPAPQATPAVAGKAVPALKAAPKVTDHPMPAKANTHDPASRIID